MKQDDLVQVKKCNLLVLMSVLIITAIVFSGSLKLEWTNWDDNLLVYDNPLVQTPNIKEIFTKPAVYNTYNPLVILTFALEWKLVKDSPFLYHLNNLLLHLFCTALAFLFFRQLGLSIWWSGFAALLFGIHPMRVESVAWVTERKDVLYGFFYLLALLAYIRYIVSDKKAYFLLAFVLFVLSLLSKGQAVALPFSLILLDWYFGRKIAWKVITEKIIFLIFALFAGLLGTTFFFPNVYTNPDEKSIVNAFNFFEQLVLAGYAFMIYILKFFLPYATSTLYPRPDVLQTHHWTGAVAAVLIFAGAMAVRRQYKFITFGLLFFAFNIVFLLMPFLANDSAYLNDRYIYLAHIGLSFAAASVAQQFADHKLIWRLPVSVMAAFVLMIFSVLTITYIPVWKNSETLWTYVIEKYPNQMAEAHFNRGNDRYENNQPDGAMDDFTKAMDINPAYSTAYMNRSLLYLERNENQKALDDYNRYMELVSPVDAKGNLLNSMLSDSHRHRGVIHFKMALYDKALHDFNIAIEYDPLSFDSYMNRALTYMQLGMCERAVQDFTLCHRSAPGNSDILNNRGVCYLRLNNLQSALEDFKRAILINDKNPSYYVNRAMVYQKMGRQAEAKQDLSIAEKTRSNVE